MPRSFSCSAGPVKSTTQDGICTCQWQTFVVFGCLSVWIVGVSQEIIQFRLSSHSVPIFFPIVLVFQKCHWIFHFSVATELSPSSVMFPGRIQTGSALVLYALDACCPSLVVSLGPAPILPQSQYAVCECALPMALGWIGSLADGGGKLASADFHKCPTCACKQQGAGQAVMGEG